MDPDLKIIAFVWSNDTLENGKNKQMAQNIANRKERQSHHSATNNHPSQLTITHYHPTHNPQREA